VAEPGDHERDADRLTKIPATPDLRFAVTVDNLGSVTKRDVKVALTLKQSPAPIVRTGTLARVDPAAANPPTVIFRNRAAKIGALSEERSTDASGRDD
jgi:hypothetical protein